MDESFSDNKCYLLLFYGPEAIKTTHAIAFSMALDLIDKFITIEKKYSFCNTVDEALNQIICVWN